MTISMSQDQYQALLDFAFDRRSDTDALTNLQRVVDTANGVQRFFLYIRWMDRGGSPPSRIEIGRGWPSAQEFKLRLDRPITREDVNDVLNKQAKNPVYPTVTSDENGVVGWTELDVWDFNTVT